MASLAGMPRRTAVQPIAPRPLLAPNLPPSPQAPPFRFAMPSLGAAPTPTPTAAFAPPTGPDPYQFRIDQANRGAERSAAARGTLLSGGFQAALARLNQGMASEETDKIYGRARDAYALDRDTNAQNFGQNLASYSAETGAALDAGRLSLAGSTASYDRDYGAGRDAVNDARDAAGSQATVINANAQAEDLYRQQMEEYRAALDAQRQAETARQNAATAAATGTMPIRRPLPGQAPILRRK